MRYRVTLIFFFWKTASKARNSVDFRALLEFKKKKKKKSKHNCTEVVMFFFFFPLIWLLFPALTVVGEQWLVSSLGVGHAGLTSIDDLAQVGAVDAFNASCLGGTNHTMHSEPNPVRPRAQHPHSVQLEGTTIWINEFQAVGHAMFDIPILQALHVTDVTRIVLQRAPCARKDFCEGVGTWAGFFRGLYLSMLESAKKLNVPVYVRFYENETAWQPKVSPRAAVTALPPPIPVENNLCFERVIRRHCDGCFHRSVSRPVARTFKQAAYQFATADGPQSLPKEPTAVLQPALPPALPYVLPQSQEVVVTLAHRGNHYRSMADYRILAHALRDALEARDVTGKRRLNVTFNVLNTSTLANKAAAEQIREFHRWQVVVATHGAFEGNVMFFREGALLVEICGKEPRRWTRHCEDYHQLSNLFLVFHRIVKAADLREERQPTYVLAKPEIDHIVAIVTDYLQQKPWLQLSASEVGA